MEGEGAAQATSHGEQLAAISTGLVKLHAEYYGRGPTKAKTYAVNDTIFCMLIGGFTTIEKTLIADGKADEVESVRRSFQGTMKQRFTEVVEAALGRTVIGYMSQIHTDPDVAIEVFLLEPKEEALLGQHELENPDPTQGGPTAPRGG